MKDPNTRVARLYGTYGMYALAFSPDGRRLAAGNSDGTTRVWDTTDLQADPVILRGHERWIRQIAFGPDGRRLATAGADETVRLWDLDSPWNEPATVRGQFGGNAVAFHPDGRRIAVSDPGHSIPIKGNSIKLWDLGAPGTPPVVVQDGESPHLLAFDARGRLLAGEGEDGVCKVWEVEDPMREPILLKGDESAIRDLVFSPDGRELFMIQASGAIRRWDLGRRTESAATMHVAQGPRKAIALHHGGRWLAAAGDDEEVRLWDLTTPGSAPEVIKVPGEVISSLAFDPLGRWLAGGSQDENVRLWDAHKFSSPARILQGQGEEVAFSHDGKWLAATGGGAVRIWNLNHIEAEPVTLPDHPSMITKIAFGFDDRRLITVCDDGSIRLWSLGVKDLIDIAERVAGRNLTFAEWRRYFPGSPYRPTFLDLPIPDPQPIDETIARNLTAEEWREAFPRQPYRKTFPDQSIPGK
jgi:WD40 repeat protein